MSLFLLDTNFVSELQHNHRPTIEAVEANLLSGNAVGITAVTIEEQFDGWMAVLKAAKTNERMEWASRSMMEAVLLWSKFALSPMTANAQATFQRLRRSKLNVGSQDLRIAAIALELDATVATRNLRDFRRVPNLKFVDWSATILPSL